MSSQVAGSCLILFCPSSFSLPGPLRDFVGAQQRGASQLGTSSATLAVRVWSQALELCHALECILKNWGEAVRRMILMYTYTKLYHIIIIIHDPNHSIQHNPTCCCFWTWPPPLVFFFFWTCSSQSTFVLRHCEQGEGSRTNPLLQVGGGGFKLGHLWHLWQYLRWDRWGLVNCVSPLMDKHW